MCKDHLQGLKKVLKIWYKQWVVFMKLKDKKRKFLIKCTKI